MILNDYNPIVEIEDRTVFVSLCYPRIDENAHTVEIGLDDVRAADSIRVLYDFDRDGWVIQQASKFSWAVGDDEMDQDFQEVAFIKAWARGSA